MGRRLLRVSPEFLVEFLKQREDWPRAYTVFRALPDDARLVGISVARWHREPPEAAVISLWLESEAWQGTEGELLDPCVTVHLLDPVKLEVATR